MKRTLFALLTVFALASIAGCACDHGCRSCKNEPCERESSGGCTRGCSGDAAAMAQAGADANPYYTTRGPRDFYTTKPYASIGP